MCHPGVPFLSRGGLVVQRRWLMFQLVRVDGQVLNGGDDGGDNDNSSEGVSVKAVAASGGIPVLPASWGIPVPPAS
ncbi:hypothetical protein TanjilG_30737 [Lupinus angustifolius]|uniref:Uncharacterized protein n=1 Tax=Lupinus angustifolius TaxID=3871 RepID=A0A1J7HMQ5_LUPAN|nr:hypothetical protein TanjilG_30737 [Lupinus angustifolius]